MPPAKPDDVKAVQASGFFVGGEKYVALRSDESRLYGKKVHIYVFVSFPLSLTPSLGLYVSPNADYIPTRQGKEGIVIVKTKQALLIAHYPETVQPGSATNTVEMMGEYLSKLGY